MRAVVQRVSRGRVVVDGRVTGEIGAGLVVFLGVGRGDGAAAAAYLADKITHLRIFEDAEGKMNRSLLEAGGAVLVVSQFTLYGDVRSGRRPGFGRAARAAEANILYNKFLADLTAAGVPFETGIFHARMTVELANEGPVTILLDSEGEI